MSNKTIDICDVCYREMERQEEKFHLVDDLEIEVNREYITNVIQACSLCTSKIKDRLRESIKSILIDIKEGE